MGWSHNRFYVRARLLTLLSDNTDASTVAMAVDIIEHDPRAAGFYVERAASFELAEEVRAALAQHARAA
jgi:hypothetical protein